MGIKSEVPRVKHRRWLNSVRLLGWFVLNIVVMLCFELLANKLEQRINKDLHIKLSTDAKVNELRDYVSLIMESSQPLLILGKTVAIQERHLRERGAKMPKPFRLIEKNIRSKSTIHVHQHDCEASHEAIRTPQDMTLTFNHCRATSWQQACLP